MDITIPLDDLRVSAIDSQPLDRDWSQNRTDEDGDPTVEFYQTEVITLDSGDVTVVSDGFRALGARDRNGVWVDLRDEPTADYAEENTDDEGSRIPGAFTDEELSELTDAEVYAEGPMMNYWYPITVDFDPEVAAKITGPLCLVQIDGESVGLALTGGGMNLSWEICEAFIELGYLPPTHFSELPAMAGIRPLSPEKQYVARAMVQSLTVQQGWLARSAQRLSDTYNLTEGTPADGK